MPDRPRLALIAAVARNRVIGRGGRLVWREAQTKRISATSPWAAR